MTPRPLGPHAAALACAVLAMACGAQNGARDTPTPSVADPAVAAPDFEPAADDAVPLPPNRTEAFHRVADPRPGDLRVDDHADLLPADYRPEDPTVRTGLAYGDHPAQLLDLHLPDAPDAPTVVFIHAGGWGPGGRDPVPPMVLRFVERGYAVASVEYRGAPEHRFPAAVEDTKRAIRWLKTAPEIAEAIDGDRIVLFGASSGGLLAALVAATPGRFEPGDLPVAMAGADSSVAGIVSAVGPTDLVAMFPDPHPWARGAIEAWLGCTGCSDERLVEASPVTYLDGDLPPAYWAYGGLDPIVDATVQGATMAAAWGERVGADNSWFDLVDGQAHNLDHTTINQRALERFVDRTVGRIAAAEG